MKIILVGMPGSGKSTVGKQLSSNLNLNFIDLDEEIEKAEGKKVKEIFSVKGEDYFREAESRLLHRVIGTEDNFVLATGGGAPCFHNGMDSINQHGVSIFLDVPMDELVTRVENDLNRPLLQTENKEELKIKLTAIRSSRLLCYQQAHVIVNSSDFADVMEAISSKTKSDGNNKI